jgi:hypothetical protein
MNPVVHFEMPARDRERMVDFYTRVFGWRAQQLGPEMGDYVVVTTTDTDVVDTEGNRVSLLQPAPRVAVRPGR